MTKYLIINEILYPVYADLTDANVYNNAIYGSTWSSLTETAQKQLLVQATRKIDSYQYAGSKLSETQPLQFPRISASGKTSDEQVLINLCCQIADYIYKNGSSGSGGEGLLSGVTKWQLGDLHISLKDDATFDLGGLDDFIEDALSDWLISNSMQIWL